MFSLSRIIAKNLREKCLGVVVRCCSTKTSNIITSHWNDIEVPKITLNELIYDSCVKHSNRVALECAITKRKYTYEDILNKAKNLDRNLRKQFKLKKGDVLALYVSNCPEFAITVFAALKGGLTVTTLNYLQTADEISKQLIDSGAKVIVTLVELWSTANKSLEIIGQRLPIITIRTKNNESIPEGAIDYFQLLENVDYPDVPPVSTYDVAFLPYSSGTTGLPKGVQLTHNNIVSNIKQGDVLGAHLENGEDVVPIILPQFHIYGFTVNTLYGLIKGSKLITLPMFTPDSYLDLLINYKPTILYLVPPLVLFLAGHQSVTEKHLESVRIIVSGAAPLGATDEEQLFKKAKKDIAITQGYGLTETSPIVTGYHPDMVKGKNVRGTIGKVLPLTQAKVINLEDPNQTPLGPNQIGELLVKGPQVMKGYLNRPKETEEVLSKDGWLKTGDLVYYNEDKFFFVKDRVKELIKVKGFQVPPAELEAVIRSHPNVAEAAVIGVPDSRLGEAPRAYIVPKHGKTIDVEEINSLVAEKAASYKQLKGGIKIVESIPKNASGKILRRILKEKYMRETS